MATTPPWPGSSWSSEAGGGATTLVSVKLTIAYDGGGFHGFAANPGVRTVAGMLTETLERVLGYPVEITGAGRTDAGVHAWGQVVSFAADAEALEVTHLQRALNGLCGPELVVRSAEIADETFDARRSATSRRYRYQVLENPVPDPFLARTAWHVGVPLHRRALELACDPIIGTHDFAAFCRRPKQGADDPLVRSVRDARWEDAGEGLLWFWIEANAFCHQMVRSIVGTMVDIGRGKRTAGELTAILTARSRQYAGPVAPPHGLTLWEVTY